MCEASDCIFCKIINGEIPSAKVYEDENVYAFLDLGQVTKGHTLIIPKVHTKDIFHLDPVVAEKLFRKVPAIARAIQKAFHPVGMNLLNNNSELAGQSVFHYHLHLIPRYGAEDTFSFSFQSHTDEYSNEARAEIAQAIANALN
ncbi:HIT family protein [Sporolactobacillus inulinus]|uniref:Histidine triad nucleotide-binding protein n=2 Tax=Sporolactobacillus inulinus TaxID=2078 RepID=A0A4Y3T0M4_9BACL|nr:HIT family protein [Sporolactobacillus inulinus]KLI02466.1 protein hit [Sporolactobacillus inulinus CASD]GAY77374.1 histidine triad nucleotide-binding protein [Sporolactobacillus inulinus]GEB75796.1 protein hit [Sporolactobacillus inulinus]